MTAPRLRLTAPPTPTRRLKVMFLIDSLGPGGAERLMIDLLPRLAAIGVDSNVVSIQERQGNPVAAELASLGFPVENLGIERLRERGALARVTEAIEQHSPDLVHTQLEFSNILGSIAADRLGIPTIATVHTLDRPGRFTRAGLRFRLMAWTLRHRSRRVVAVSESGRQHVLARAGLPQRHTVTIHNGIDLDPFVVASSVDRARTRSQLGIDPARPIVTTVAVLREEKGVQHMLDAMPQVLAQHADTLYCIVGDGPHRSNLEARATDLGISEATRFLGHRDDVPAVLAASDVFVLPSLTEALPTVVIEAMAAGVPVVATDVGGTAEIVGTEALLVPAGSPDRLGDAVARLLTTPRQRRAMSAGGRRRAAERFSVERHAARLLDEYRVLAQSGGRR